MKPANNAPFYAAGLYPKLAEVFRSHGYALAVHGSVARDFDLIAVPWTDSAGDPQAVIAEVLEKFAVKYAGCEIPDPRPHGRLAYKLALSFADHALDISFTPRAAQETFARQPVFALRCPNGHEHPKDTQERACHCGLDICRVAL